MNILFDNNTGFIIDENIVSLINKCIEESLNLENFTTNVEISLSIVDNKEIKEINALHRNINKETDVLSFPLLDDFNNIDNNILHPIPLGDIIISIDKAISQANDYGHSLERELCFLTVHSMLHLLGYDHMTEEEEKIMFKKQDIILNKLNIKR
ncbi:rRNA maturation RNase YbeY [uncultured Tyzzerella sp.]|uniref:rRNA maturation RNase YbeY n=1 Tax=uncultured Tyzzerella sp. TaxID=2321398 RepID=UPI0029435444|nr:rRNA maturation RNase YbeY [uncultured Tyzzerella sp.]